MREARSLSANYRQIGLKIAAVERAVLAFQAGMVSAAGRCAADDTNTAIILAARLAAVWKRLGIALPARACP